MTRHETAIAKLAGQTQEARRLAGLVLVRIAVGRGTEPDIGRDLMSLVPSRANPEIWRVELARLIVALQAGGLVDRQGDDVVATPAGELAAIEFLGNNKALPSSWAQARDRSLLALALGIERGPAARLKQLAKADGLRGLIVIQNWKLGLKGAPSASRIRSALAVKALERAFGNRIGTDLGDKSTLPAKAGRLLAGQLSDAPRDFGTDARLVAALAAEVAGARKSDLKSLQLAVLRRFFGGDAAAEPVRKQRKRRGRRAAGQEKGSGVSAATAGTGVAQTIAPATPATSLLPPLPPIEPQRPDPAGFASTVNSVTNEVAEGWAGNRKAFISRVWDVIRERWSSWALTEIEFKCMLAEAHRTGLVVLANADLKDKRFLKEFQDSAVVYKNTVWHYVRVQN